MAASGEDSKMAPTVSHEDVPAAVVGDEKLRDIGHNDSDSTATPGLETNEDGHLTLKESLKRWRRIVWYSLAMAMPILMYGFDTVIVGTVMAMPSFQYVIPPAALNSHFQNQEANQ